MQYDQPHPFMHTTLKTINNHVLNLFVSSMTPPSHNVGVGKHSLGQTILWLFQMCRAYRGGSTEMLLDSRLDCHVHAFRVDAVRGWIGLFTGVFMPNCHANGLTIHGILQSS